MKKHPTTKTGQPRKRAPGAGRPRGGRTINLGRVTPEVKAALSLLRITMGEKGAPLSEADVIERVVMERFREGGKP